MSYVLTGEAALASYDEALVEWQVRFGFPVLNRSLGGMFHGTGFQDVDQGGRARYWARSAVMDRYFWALMLRTLAVGGDGPILYVTWPGSIFVRRGPFQANLRSILERVLIRNALPQNKARLKGYFVHSNQRDPMRIRVPHG